MTSETQNPPPPVHGGRGVQAESWLVRNALQLVTAMLVALFGWSVNTTMRAVADDISDNTARLEHLERRIDHLEARIEYTYQQQTRRQ
jgi:hypothetical protein